MNKAGGIISIIAGIFGVMAAVTTLFIGGMGAAFKADGANQIVGFGWGGVLFSFLVIVFGAVAFSKPKFSGIAIIVSSLFGAILGGTLVAICMVLSFIGGILVLFGKDVSNQITLSKQITVDDKNKKPWLAISLGFLALIIALIIIGKNGSNKSSTTEPEIKAEKKVITDPITELEKNVADPLQPNGELGALFALGSKNTDLQRENKLKEITGKVVQWRLPVYEVRSAGDGYKIQTNTEVTINPTVGTFIKIKARNETEKQFIEALKTGDTITFKGVIKDTTMRNLDIDPAILILESDTTVSAPAQPEPKQVVVTEQPEPQAEQVQQTPSEPATTTEQNKTWVGDWGNGIIATVSSQPCGNNELISQSYNYLMFVSIPKSRLKKPDDAWQVLGNRAVTITGCWIKNPDSMIHAKLNKKNGKTWEQDFKMTDGNWTEKGGSDSTNEPAKYLSSSPLDEANTKINTVWNGTIKEVRAMLLPEQRAWLKQRESDCSLVAEKINCMVTMTDLRTEILKQKIAVLEKKS